MSSDKELIQQLGGPAKVAEMLGFTKPGGVQRVHNWTSRGIPASVKLRFPAIFLKQIPGMSASATPQSSTTSNAS